MTKSDYILLAGCTLIACGLFAIYRPLTPIFVGIVLAMVARGLKG